MKKINFLIGLHCHQPVDNFGNIFEEAYAKSYEPFLSVLEKHPGIKLSIHYSGSLFDWLLKNKRNFIERVKSLVEKGQVEILTGGYYEPILSMVPAHDAKGQIDMLTELIEKLFNYKPQGAWLTERVWDPALSSVFSDANVKYTIIDDFHLKQAGVKPSEVFGHYLIRGSGKFHVFASIKRLRYTMPFREPEVTIDYLKEVLESHNAASVTFADDCEKFGLWPHTYDWVYKKGWLEKLFTKLEENDWVRTLTFSEALKEENTRGEIFVPHSSYAEMIEWSNGNFNNFFKKYPESDLMKRRMLTVSKKISEYKSNTQENDDKNQSVDNARMELYKAQSNCAYWHGIFGGVYVTYLRQGIYKHLIKSEEALKNKNDMEVKLISFYQDAESGENKNVIFASNKFLTLFIDPNKTGSIFEIDYKPLPFNLVNTMSRRPEPYHKLLKKRKRVDVEELKRKADKGEAIDLYEVLGTRERNLKRFLNYDGYGKFSFICHIMDLKTSINDFIKSTHIDKENTSFLGRYDHSIKKNQNELIINLTKDGNVNIDEKSRTFRINKCIILQKDAEMLIKIDLENTSPEKTEFIFGVEFNWAIEDKAFMRNRKKNKIKEMTLIDKFCGLKINHIFEEPIDAWSFPVYTLNETEQGLGKTFQEVSLLFHKKIDLNSKEKCSFSSRVRVSEC